MSVGWVFPRTPDRHAPGQTPKAKKPSTRRGKSRKIPQEVVRQLRADFSKGIRGGITALAKKYGLRRGFVYDVVIRGLRDDEREPA